MYSEKVMDHFNNPRNVGEIENPSGVGTVGNAKCGDIMRMYLDIDDNGIIKEAKFKTFGCVGAIVSSEVACILIKGQNLDYVSNLPQEEILNYLGQMPQGKEECATMAIKTIKEAVKNYRKKQLQLAIKMQRDLEKASVVDEPNV